jgi:hypothetical protein
MITRRDRARLVIPPRLAMGVLLVSATASCPAPQPSDAGRDVSPDVPADMSAIDQVVADVVDAVDVSDASDATDVPSDIVTDMPLDALDDVNADGMPDACDAQPFTSGAFACLMDPHADADVACPTTLQCSASGCPAGCVACPTSPIGDPGFTCVPQAGVDASTCPDFRVCNASDCPPGCDACSEPFFCLADSMSDTPGAPCTPMQTCSPSGCPPGCNALG